MLCRNCGHFHVGGSPDIDNVCTSRNPMCMCDRFESATEERPVINLHQKYLEQMEKVSEKVKYILINFPELRESGNKEFVFNYWFLCDGLKSGLDKIVIDRLVDPEIIRRAKQKLVEENSQKYGPTKEKVRAAKQQKYWGIYEYVTSQ